MNDGGMKAVADFINSDTNVRNSLINDLMQSKENVFSDSVVSQVRRALDAKGINLTPEEISKCFDKTFSVGVERFIGEMDNSRINENHLLNSEVELDKRGVSNAIERFGMVSESVERLKCSGSRVPSAWYDFVNRSLEQIQSQVSGKYGPRVEREFYELMRHDERTPRGLTNLINDGLLETLHETYRKTHSHVDEMEQCLDGLKSAERSISQEDKKSSDLSTMFK